MLDELSPLANLSRFDVELTGDWGLAPEGVWEWNGEAVAEGAFVGIGFVRCGNRMYWAKSGTPFARIGTQGSIASRRDYNKLGVRLRLQGRLRVQFMYWIGLSDGIHRAVATLKREEDRPPIAHSRTVQTGYLFTFAQFDSTPATTLYMMFLEKQDVKMRRNHIWGLHKPFLATLKSPLLEVFTKGRFGEFGI